MPEFQNGAASVHYEILGEGEPLLLIAGTASDGASWGPLLPLLPNRQLILIDNRGSGQTRVDGPITHREMVDDCAALLNHLGLQQADVVGHSLGGYLGLGLAASYPERVIRLITMGTAYTTPRINRVLQDLAPLYFIVPPQLWFRQLYPWLFSDAFFRRGEAAVAAAAAASTDYAYRQSPGDYARQMAAMDSYLEDDFTTIACPVLALSGEFDLIAPPDAVAGLHASIRRAQHITIQNAAHSIHWEAPQAVAGAINGFLG